MITFDCSTCGCSHDSAAQADGIHLATASIHAWLRAKMLHCTAEPEPLVIRTRAKKPALWEGKPL